MLIDYEWKLFRIFPCIKDCNFLSSLAMNGNISEKHCHLRYIPVVFQPLRLTGTTFFMGRLRNESTVACVTHQHSSTAFPETVKVFDQLHIKGCEEVAMDSEQVTINPLHGMMANNTIIIIWVFCFLLLFLHLSRFLTLCCRFLTLCCRCNWRSRNFCLCNWRSRNFCLSNIRTRTPRWRWIQRRRFSCLRCLQRIFQSGCVPVTGGLEFVDYLVIQRHWVIERRYRLELVKHWLTQWRSGMEVVEHYVIQRRNGLEFVEHCVGLKNGECWMIQRRNGFVSSHFRETESFRNTRSTIAILIVRPELTWISQATLRRRRYPLKDTLERLVSLHHHIRI